MSKRQKSQKTNNNFMHPTQVERVQNLRRSGASGSHDSRARGRRTRSGEKRAAIASGW